MERKLASAEEIRQTIDGILNSQQELLADRTKIEVQLPERREPDADGCNWRIDFVGPLAGHEAVISRVITQIRGQYNLIR